MKIAEQARLVSR